MALTLHSPAINFHYLPVIIDFKKRLRPVYSLLLPLISTASIDVRSGPTSPSMNDPNNKILLHLLILTIARLSIRS